MRTTQTAVDFFPTPNRRQAASHKDVHHYKLDHTDTALSSGFPSPQPTRRREVQRPSLLRHTASGDFLDRLLLDHATFDLLKVMLVSISLLVTASFVMALAVTVSTGLSA